MKKVLISLMLVMAIVMMSCSFAVASATNNIYFDVIDGRKVMFGDIGVIVDYLCGLNRQQVINSAIINRGQGEFYARILPGQWIYTWSDDSPINACDLTEDMQSYSIVANGMMLVQDEHGNVEVKDANPVAWSLDNIDYPENVYSPADMALVEKYTLAESYKDSSMRDTFDEKKGFQKHELFKALVLGTEFFEEYQQWGYFMAWKVVKEPTSTEKTFTKKISRSKPSEYHSDDTQPTKRPSESDKPTHTPDTNTPAHSTPRPTATPKPESTSPAHSTPRPTATPRVSNEEDQFEGSHSTRKPSSNPTSKPDHTQEDEDYVAEHSIARPSKDEGVIKRDPQDEEDYTASHSIARPSKDDDVFVRDKEDGGNGPSHSYDKPSSNDEVIKRDDKDDGSHSSSHSEARPSKDEGVIKRDKEDRTSSSSDNKPSKGDEVVKRDSDDSSRDSSASSHSEARPSRDEDVFDRDNRDSGSSESHRSESYESISRESYDDTPSWEESDFE